MEVVLCTKAENYAKEAEQLTAFMGISLQNIKQAIATLLSLVGREGIFDQYTRHDISHVDGMLEMLDWLIPEKTKEIMNTADWLLIVLSIYFHDLGMLVTKREFEMRDSSGFPEYRDKVLFGGDNGKDYHAKVQETFPEPEQTDRFLYQEFVRHKHAERVRAWIEGKASEELGIAEDAMEEVSRLLCSFNNPRFRRALALVCESHHMDDLSDLKKYKIFDAYGNSDKESANIQYAAAILRTADLLHITSDRTPSIAYRIINPTDPISQEEWAKQIAVTRVGSQVGLDRDGKPDANAPRDTIEVYAYFTEENGYFGLTSYLTYAEKQLSKTHEWVTFARKSHWLSYEFPWTHIDQNNIETEGFLRSTFKFTIDQPNILDLLTGHTLYNNTDIVLRELVQNSLDAVRLQMYDDNGATHGKVDIHWDSEKRVLTVKDNGTGMTQQIIEKHLLKVGASRYQDPEFTRQYPDFSSISRFGIGVLSTFMVADKVEITTCHLEEDKVRQISLRSVHGKYLIRLLDKYSSEITRELAPHGTQIKLTLRPSAELSDILSTAQKWIVIPQCDVFVTVDNNPAIKIGYSSPKETLEQIIHDAVRHQNEGAIRVVQQEIDGVTIAYALRWYENFQYWQFIKVSELFSNEDEANLILGTCVEGIRVSFDTPGYDGRVILAIANATGKNAPKTNVARSALEETSQLSDMLRKVYKSYCDQVGEEVRELYQNRSCSLTWASQEASFLILPLLDTNRERSARSISYRFRRKRVRRALESYYPSALLPNEEPLHILDHNLFIEYAKDIPLLIIESQGERYIETLRKLSTYPYFWLIDCPLLDSAEWLLREVPSSNSLTALLQGLGATEFRLPSEPIYREVGLSSEVNNTISEIAFAYREIDKIVIRREQRRVDLRWTRKSDPSRWLTNDIEEYSAEEQRIIRDLGEEISFIRSRPRLLVGVHDIEVEGMEGDNCIQLENEVYVPCRTQLADYIVNYHGGGRKASQNLMLFLIDYLINSLFFLDEIEDALADIAPRDVDPYAFFDLKTIMPLVRQVKLFRNSAWRRI